MIEKGESYVVISNYHLGPTFYFVDPKIFAVIDSFLVIIDYRRFIYISLEITFLEATKSYFYIWDI